MYFINEYYIKSYCYNDIYFVLKLTLIMNICKIFLKKKNRKKISIIVHNICIVSVYYLYMKNIFIYQLY